MASFTTLRAASLGSAFVLGWSGIANAQASSVEPLVVIGNTQVDIPAEALKRKASGIVDSLTARDVARTPDTTLAEALDRVVGASSDKFTQTTEAGSVSVRGFDARYNSMDIDGSPVWFTSQNNRGAQLAIFPASIVNQINVYKTVTADQDGNSVGGHIGLRTLRAFDGGSSPYLSLGARVGAYDQEGQTEGKGPSYRVYGAGKTTFGKDAAYGLVLGFDAQRTNAYDRYAAVDGYTQVSGVDYVNGGIYQGRYDKNIRRDAVYGKLEAAWAIASTPSPRSICSMSARASTCSVAVSMSTSPAGGPRISTAVGPSSTRPSAKPRNTTTTSVGARYCWPRARTIASATAALSKCAAASPPTTTTWTCPIRRRSR